jgi:hypothetical protein
MKKLLAATLLVGLVHSAWAITTINSTNHFSYGANIGWIEWRGDNTSGAVIGEFVCSGSIYAANVGWISLGGGTPINGIRYQNNSASDFGVNHDGNGNLQGYAYGANIGWLTFTNRDGTGASYAGPRVDLLTGKLSGYIWSGNVGWIDLSNAQAFVRTDVVLPGPDTDGDGIADAFERLWTGNLTTMNATSDFDHDGFSDLSEYLADTNPTDATSNLRIVNYSVSFTSQEVHALTWSSRPSRLYQLQHRLNLNTNTPWVSLGANFPPSAGTSTSAGIALSPINGQRYWQVIVLRPLGP